MLSQYVSLEEYIVAPGIGNQVDILRRRRQVKE